MTSVFKEVQKLSCDPSIGIDSGNYNRYMVVTGGHDRTRTAYCFGVPIYNSLTGNLVHLKFRHRKTESTYMGSSARITITDAACLADSYGYCKIFFPGKITRKTENKIFTASTEGCTEISPTLNGLLFQVPCANAQSHTIRMTLSQSFESIRTNDKYFAVMRERFIPFITVSCIGTQNDRGEVIAPCEVDFQRIDEKEYILTFKPKSDSGVCMAYEINMQEKKLFQDTTVESKHPTMNNAFGGVAFLGKTETFGEQWLYSRLEFSNLQPLQNKKILRAILHIPRLGHRKPLLTANRISARFCSFGANWKNKISVTNPISKAIVSNGYYHFDITELFATVRKTSENFVVRTENSVDKPVIISTGDSFYSPQILEIKFRS